MNLKEWSQQARGRQSQLAAHLKVPSPNVSAWVSGSKSPSVKTAVAIEQFTDGQVTRKDMFPQDWHLIWPELVSTNQGVEGVSHG